MKEIRYVQSDSCCRSGVTCTCAWLPSFKSGLQLLSFGFTYPNSTHLSRGRREGKENGGKTVSYSPYNQEGVGDRGLIVCLENLPESNLRQISFPPKSRDRKRLGTLTRDYASIEGCDFPNTSADAQLLSHINHHHRWHTA